MPRAADHRAAWKSDGRLIVNQRADVRARAGRGLRPLASARQSGLEPCRRAAVFPQGGEPGARRRRMARRGRAAQRLRPRTCADRRSLHRGRRAVRLSAQPGFQRRATGGLWLLPVHHAQRAALLDGGRLPQAGAQAREPDGGLERSGDARAVRGQARGRDRVPAGRHDPHGARQCRSASLRRRVQFAAIAAASPAPAPPICCASTGST